MEKLLSPARVGRLLLVLAATALLAGQAFAALIVREARYEAGRSSRDVTSVIRSYVQGDRLEVRVTNRNMGCDPAPGLTKRLHVWYQVRRDGEVMEAVVVENDILSLVGRPDGPPPGPHGGQGDLEIIQARYGAKWLSWDVTRRLNRYIRGNQLQVVVNNQNMGGDPAPGSTKRLTVTYSYRGYRSTVEVPEYQLLVLPAGGNRPGPGHGRRLEILDADYGYGNRWRDVTGILQDRVYRGRLELSVDNRSLGGDPAPGRDKELRVVYRVNGSRRQITAYEGEYLVLPEDVGYDDRD